MKRAALTLSLLLGATAPAFADVQIGITLGGYPQLEPVPGYPVYYAPRVNANYFFYDGLYWVYRGDQWYASSWYNGPWRSVPAFDVPDNVLRVPVRYYRQAPTYFRDWQADAAPRWGDQWGNDWTQRRGNWSEWDSRSAPARAPLPVYQQQYSGARYPQAELQQSLQAQNYRYQPRDEYARRVHDQGLHLGWKKHHGKKVEDDGDRDDDQGHRGKHKGEGHDNGKHRGQHDR